jgi:hypothetical protein
VHPNTPGCGGMVHCRRQPVLAALAVQSPTLTPPEIAGSATLYLILVIPGLIMYIAGKLMISVCSSTTVIYNFFMNSKLSRNKYQKEWALSPLVNLLKLPSFKPIYSILYRQLNDGL